MGMAWMDGKGDHLVKLVPREAFEIGRKDAMKEKNEKDAFKRTRNASLSQQLSGEEVDEYLRQLIRREIWINLFSRKWLHCDY